MDLDGFFNESDSIENDEINKCLAELENIEIPDTGKYDYFEPKPHAVPDPAPVEFKVAECSIDSAPEMNEFNILVDSVMEKFTQPSEQYITKNALSPLIMTTAAVGGELRNYPEFFNGQRVDEKYLQNNLEPDEKILVVYSNMGRNEHPNYVRLCEEGKRSLKKPSNRGRPRRKKVSTRSIPEGSSGTQMNSQATVIMISDEKCSSSKRTVHGYKEWNPKIFNNGKIQMAGVNPRNMNQVLKCIDMIVDKLNDHFYSEETDPDKKISIVSLIKNNLNFKFFIEIHPGSRVDIKKLSYLFQIILAVQKYSLGRLIDKSNDCACGSIFDENPCVRCLVQRIPRSVYNTIIGRCIEVGEQVLISDFGEGRGKISRVVHRDECMTLKFWTPVATNPKKMMHLQIYKGSQIGDVYDTTNPDLANKHGAKINIKGALKTEDAQAAHEYIGVIWKYFADIVVVSPKPKITQIPPRIRVSDAEVEEFVKTSSIYNGVDEFPRVKGFNVGKFYKEKITELKIERAKYQQAIDIAMAKYIPVKPPQPIGFAGPV